MGLTLLIQPVLSSTTHALIPGYDHKHRYIKPDYTYAYYTTTKEAYIKNTLPNEWGYAPTWHDNALQAGAVIIRSGVYWRVNRSALNSQYPNNNCYKGGSGSTVYYRTVPTSRGGQEQWLPGSRPGANRFSYRCDVRVPG